MKLSVRLITYNHAPFIAQALVSVLMQQTNFDFEIVIGEDGSNDGTREICLDYQKRHPDKIRVLLNDRKNVIYINGKPTGRWNFMNTIRQCRGQYIALLDGDDYWTNPHKLQKQVDLLDQNPDCSFCFHDIETLHKDGTRTPGYELIHVKKPWFTLHDLFAGQYYPPTCSVVYRTGLFQDFPPWYTKVVVADFPLHIMNADHGKVGYIDEIMGVYRHHAGGIWTQYGTTDVPGKSTIAQQQAEVELLEYADAYLGHRYRDIIGIRLSMGAVRLIKHYHRLGDFKQMRRFWIAGYGAWPKNPHGTPAFFLKSAIVAFCPPIYKFYRFVTRAKKQSSPI